MYKCINVQTLGLATDLFILSFHFLIQLSVLWAYIILVYADFSQVFLELSQKTFAVVCWLIKEIPMY